MPISVSNTRRGSVVTVAVAGDVDLATGPAMAAAVTEAIATPGATEVDVDLSGVVFLDSSGISVLLNGRRNADERGVTFRVSGAHDAARRILEMTGVWAHLAHDGSQGSPRS